MYSTIIVRRIYFREFKKNNNLKNGEDIFQEVIKKGKEIYQMDRGLSNAQISKSLGIPESTVRYYRNRPDIKQIKRASKLPQKYIDKIYEMASNKTTREMPGGLIAIKINNMLKKDKVLNKNGKLLTITKSQVNRILKDKYGNPLRVIKFFTWMKQPKKRD